MSEQPPSPDPPARAVARPGSIGVAVYDANCLFSKHLRYLLLGFAVYRIADGRWSRKLLEETAASLAAKLAATRSRTSDAGSRPKPSSFVMDL